MSGTIGGAGKAGGLERSAAIWSIEEEDKLTIHSSPSYSVFPIHPSQQSFDKAPAQMHTGGLSKKHRTTRECLYEVEAAVLLTSVLCP